MKIIAKKQEIKYKGFLYLRIKYTDKSFIWYPQINNRIPISKSASTILEQTYQTTLNKINKPVETTKGQPDLEYCFGEDVELTCDMMTEKEVHITINSGYESPNILILNVDGTYKIKYVSCPKTG